MRNLVLYHRPGCPYCEKVLRFIKEKNIHIPLKSTADPANREELIALGGKAQVPCLVIDGQPLYESDDIIAWLAQRRAADRQEWIELVHNRSTCGA